MQGGEGNSSIHILSIPFPTVGHILPHVELLHRLLLRGLTITVVVTPKNLDYLNPLLSFQSSNRLHILVFPFPSNTSIPHGVENVKDVDHIVYTPRFVTVLAQLKDPLVQWFQTHPFPPVAIISDFLLASWTNPLASQLNLKNLSFSVLNAHSMFHWMELILKHKHDTSEFSTKLVLGCIESWGIILNTFTELDGDKIKSIQEEFTKHDRLWALGPLQKEKDSERVSIPQDQVIEWLDSCQDKSVVYIAFGSQVRLSKPQMEAVASALEKSGVRFIWAVRDPRKGNEDEDNEIPDQGFEEHVAGSGRGLVIKGWTPQLAILEHRAVGSFLTHCGWNSTLEALLSGVLLLAWPMALVEVEHSAIAKLLVDELGVAIRACEDLNSVSDATKLANLLSESVSIERPRPERVRAMKLRETAMAAIQKGGSSDKAMDGLVETLCSLKPTKN
ncbi:UDP-glucuronosyl/UDP-glucosyltransferase [Corchorus capsularis]|uniref:UDP-glucuronosyl/UDP-glucosyltransferase n=1 Tax=Corchorus capsularis TaxID=210143 RepID=A0A1R3J813_COCAP|nr:UDP-glucuronosyl/UDP-glucosyltransferase [Corchorus capsularis]